MPKLPLKICCEWSIIYDFIFFQKNTSILQLEMTVFNFKTLKHNYISSLLINNIFIQIIWLCLLVKGRLDFINNCVYMYRDV